LSAATTQALTRGVAFSRHRARLASRSPPPIPCMHAMTMGRPTVSRQLAIACSFERAAPALPLVATRARLAIAPAASAVARARRELRGEEGVLKDFCIEKPDKNEFKNVGPKRASFQIGSNVNISGGKKAVCAILRLK
jgi:hypothetical protein